MHNMGPTPDATISSECFPKIIFKGLANKAIQRFGCGPILYPTTIIASPFNFSHCMYRCTLGGEISTVLCVDTFWPTPMEKVYYCDKMTKPDWWWHRIGGVGPSLHELGFIHFEGWIESNSSWDWTNIRTKSYLEILQMNLTQKYWIYECIAQHQRC